jgi:hypothetical protein
VEFWVFQAWAWLLFGMVAFGALVWLYAWTYAKWDDRPSARRRRALARLDRAAAERERRENPPPPVPEPFRRRSGNQPW